MFRYSIIILAYFIVNVNAVFAEPAVLTVSGSGYVAVAPDMATISVGVEVEAPTADRALKLNNARMQAVMKTLTEAGIAKKDVQTSQFSVHPQWTSRASSSQQQPPKISGFVATNIVSVKVKELNRLGQVLDALTKSGANRIQGVQFAVNDPKPHKDEARKRAVHEAMRKADLYASAAGGTLGAILSLNEGGASQPVFRMEARAMADSVPIAEGELVIQADVTMQFALD